MNGHRVECVYLTCFRSTFSTLSTVLHYSGVRMHRAESLEEADFLLTVTDATAFLSDVTFPDGTWRDALGMSAELHPLTPLVVIADPIDHPFLSDTYARGACGILWKPIDFADATRAIRTIDQAAHDRVRWLAEA